MWPDRDGLFSPVKKAISVFKTNFDAVLQEILNLVSLKNVSMV